MDLIWSTEPNHIINPFNVPTGVAAEQRKTQYLWKHVAM